MHFVVLRLRLPCVLSAGGQLAQARAQSETFSNSTKQCETSAVKPSFSQLVAADEEALMKLTKKQLASGGAELERSSEARLTMRSDRKSGGERH